MASITLQDIEAAQDRIAGKVERTPTILSASLSEQLGVPVHLKLEHRQTTGAFKLRGASNAVASLSAEEKARGVVAASTGKHGRALAYSAARAKIRAGICN
jgi:threonine dehydratase